MSRFAELIGLTESNNEIVRTNNLQAGAARQRFLPPEPPLPLTVETDVLGIVLQVLRKRKFTIISFFLLVTLFVLVGSLLRKPKYEAVTRIVFNRESANPLGFKDLGDEPPADPEYTVSLDTQMQILQSDTLADHVIQELHLDKNPQFAGKAALAQTTLGQGVDRNQQQALVEKFLNSLSVSKEKNTRVIEIRYTSPDAKLSADIANAITRAYIEHNFRMRFDSTMQTSNWLTQQLTELATKVQDSQQKLVDYQKQHGLVELDDKQNVVVTRLDDLNRELTAAQADLINKEANYRLTLSENPELTEKAERDELIEKLHAQEADLKTQLAQATVQLGPMNPKVQELTNQLNETEAEINAELHKMSDRVRAQYLEALAREKMVRAAVEEQKQQANKMNETAIEYSLLKRDAESNRQLYEGLLQKLKEATVSAGLRSGNIQIVDVAQVPTVPSEPKIRLNLLIAAALGLVGGVGLAFVQERFDRTLRNVQQIQVLSPLPRLGIIPLSSPNGGKNKGQRLTLATTSSGTTPSGPLVSSDSTSPIAESYRALVNSVLLSPQVPPRTILLTSAITGEGKTTTSVNLALTLARQGKRVLLVDADLRRPSVHKAMGIAGTAGLSTLLLIRQKQPAPADIVSNTSGRAIHRVPGFPNLFVIPAGPDTPEPSALIGSDAMRDLLQEWHSQFDNVIIDSSPVLLAADAVRLSVVADAVILVVRSGHTPETAFARTQELLAQVKAPVMGVVFNAVDIASPELSYYRQYGYYGYADQPSQEDKAE